MNSRIPYQTGARPHNLNTATEKAVQPAKPTVQFSMNNDTTLSKDK
ncbi:hypothetical protein [Leptolyngbya sp. FACHB-711]|nr:hypothetical protein [Leptolyngbya sp. FACHB-711]MBD1849616.1 hypothetical protein [Cyanobacteria bacterium FACHB-502]MBD2025671.1 hypothetical protein [Leptolyngbya sp. FACHB-711]